MTPKNPPGPKGSGIKPPPGKSRSARALRYDWAALRELVEEDSWQIVQGPILFEWDRDYVHAIQKALEGRDTAGLLDMLNAGRLLHPALYPALADVIRSQNDNAKGRSKKLTAHQDAVIRKLHDTVGPNLYGVRHPAKTVAWLASVYQTSADTIRRSLKATKAHAK